MPEELDLAFILTELRCLDVFYTRRMAPEAREVYIEACRCAGTREILSEVIRDFSRYGEKFPLPKDLINAIVEKQKQTEMVATRPCQYCQGTGYIHIEKRYNTENPMLKEMYGERAIEVSKKCHHCNPTARELASQRPSKRKSELQKPGSEELRSLFEG